MKKFIVLISMILCVNQIKSSEILAGLQSVLFTYPKVTAAVLIGAVAYDSLNSYRLLQDIGRRNEALMVHEKGLDNVRMSKPYGFEHNFEFDNKEFVFKQSVLFHKYKNKKGASVEQELTKNKEDQFLDTTEHWLALGLSTIFIGYCIYGVKKLLS